MSIVRRSSAEFEFAISINGGYLTTSANDKSLGELRVMSGPCIERIIAKVIVTSVASPVSAGATHEAHIGKIWSEITLDDVRKRISEMLKRL